MSQPEVQSTRYAKSILLTALVSVGFGFSVLFAILGPLGREIGLSELQIGSILAASSLTVFFASPRWGRLSDRFGRKRIMIVGLLGYTIGNLIFTTIFQAALLGVLIPTVGYVALIVSRVLHASLMSAIQPASTAYMADITDVHTRTKGMGAVGAANNLGSVIGPAAGGLLAGISMLAPLWIASGIALLTAFFVYFLLPESPAPKRQKVDLAIPRLSYFDPRIKSYLVVGVLMFMGMAIVQQTLPFRFQDVLSLTAQETAQSFGLAMGLSAACSLAAQIFLMQRFSLPPFTWLSLSLPLLIVAYLVLAVAETRSLMVIAMMIQGMGMGIAAPAFMAGSSLAVSSDEQGAVAGIAGSCGPLGFTIGPLVGGFLYQIEPDLPYWFTFCVYVPLFLFVLRARYLSR